MISVCMATYNGEKYIAEQVQSILSQLGENDEIVVSDDGSTDNTIKIIENFNDKRIKIFNHNRQNVKIPKYFHYFPKKKNIYFLTHNFENALKNASGDYIFLSDQDDVWLPKKVETMIKFLDKDRLVVCDAWVTNENLEKLYKLSEYVKYKKGFFKNLMTRRSLAGCLCAFTKNIKNFVLPIPKTIMPHDFWLSLLSELKFSSVHVPEPLLLYRRHPGVATDISVNKPPRPSIIFNIIYRSLLLLEVLKRVIGSFFLLFLFCALPIYAEFSVSDGDRFARLKLFVKDSAQIEKFDGSENYRLQNTITMGLFLNGLAAPNLSFDAFAEVNTDKARGLTYPGHDFEPYLGYPYVVLGKQQDSKGRTWDFFRARTDWQATSYFKISGGYDYLFYGSARRNKLTLRGGDFYWRAIQDTTDYIKRPVPTPFIGWDLNLASVSYSQHAMQLKNWKDYGKYLHAHRLDFKVSDNFNFGLAETVVYGGNPSERRSMEPIYILPFVPYLFAEGYAGDRDNNGMSADFSWKLFNRLEIYGELFIDDLDNIASFFDDKWWGNKWATSIGLAIDSAKIGIFNWSYNFEYTRIEPWVYTHHKGAGTDYSHFGNSLGSDLGPNAREFYSRMGLSYRELLRFDLSVSAVAKDTALGSRLVDIHGPEDPIGKKYLDPKSTLHYQEYGAAVLFKPFSIWSLGAKQYLIFDEYKGKRTEIFSSVVW